MVTPTSDSRGPRIAVVGVGHFGRNHARILSALSDARLVAVVDVDAERAAAVAAETGATPETDVRALDGQVDAVTLAVPTEVHHAVALPLLERGIAVLVEKPMARSVAEADELIAAAAASGAVLAVGHTERYNPAVVVARSLVRSPRFIEVHRIGAFPARSLDIDVVFDVMIHDLPAFGVRLDLEGSRAGARRGPAENGHAVRARHRSPQATRLGGLVVSQSRRAGRSGGPAGIG